MRKRIWNGRFPFRGVFVAAGLLAAGGMACRGEVPVLTVCEVLSNRMVHNGEPVIVVGKYFAYEEGVSLSADCKSKVIADGRDWTNSIWLGLSREGDASFPANVPKFAQYAPKIFPNLPDKQPEKWKMVQGCSYFLGTWAAIYGRFETKNSFPLLRGEPLGFGHLGMYVAQLVHRDGEKWCLVPAQKYPEYVALERNRQEEFKAALWRNIKGALQSPGGPDYLGGLDYFDAEMKGRLLPQMKGTITSIDSSFSVITVMLAMSDRTTPEVRLEVQPSPGWAFMPGTEVEFEGVANRCTLNPFLLTLHVDADDIKVVGEQPSGPKP